VDCKSQPPSDGTPLEISVTGLRGGHSGCEIHLGRGNANKIMNRLFLAAQAADVSFEVSSIKGGSLRNAIPRESFAVVNVFDEAAFKKLIDETTEKIKSELGDADPDLAINVAASSEVSDVIEPSSQTALLAAIDASPCGVIKMSDQVEGLVETSTSLSLVGVDSGKATIEFLTRSSVESAKKAVTDQIESAFGDTNATFHHSGSYPGWSPNADSKTLGLMKGIYSEMFGKDALVNAVHAGLECGIIGSVYPGLDMVSLGPTIKNPHSPDEKCHIESVQKYWRYLLEVLKRIE